MSEEKFRGVAFLVATLSFFPKREPVHPEKLDAANEVQLTIEGSKTDIYKRGKYRNHFAHQDCTFGERLYVVEALFLPFKQAPQSFFC
jgi:hypothetical protein